MRGRKRLPTKLHLLRGNAGKRALPKGEPEPKAVLPPPPPHLDEEAVRQWNELGKKLEPLGLVTEIDVGQLAIYCAAWSRWVQAEEMLKRFGVVVIAPKSGWPVRSPYLDIANTAMAQMQRALAEFGMSPASRSRVKSGAPAKDEDPFKEFEGGGRR